MGFKPGQPRPPNAGRKAGTPNKKTKELLELLAEHNFNPGAELIWCYNQLKKISQIRAKAGNIAGAVTALSMAADVAGDVAQYVFPKKKAIEHSGEVGVRTFADFIAAGEPEESK